MTRGQKIGATLGAVLIGLPIVLIGLTGLFFHLLNPVILDARDEITGTILSGGQQRQYLLYVPETYDSHVSTPLVVSLHAAALWPGTQRDISRWNDTARRNGFIVVYPSGRRITPIALFPALPVWSVSRDAERTKDVQFISDLIDVLERRFNIDARRIYISGFSNGGAMAFATSCSMERRIAAVGIVAGTLEESSNSCWSAAPMPAIIFHGTGDRLVPFQGGKGPASAAGQQNVRSWVRRWAYRNRCMSHRAAKIGRGVERDVFSDCSGNADVTLYSIEGAGHTWPGGKPLPKLLVGETSSAIDATAMTWSFFREHPLKSR